MNDDDLDSELMLMNFPAGTYARLMVTCADLDVTPGALIARALAIVIETARARLPSTQDGRND